MVGKHINRNGDSLPPISSCTWVCIRIHEISIIFPLGFVKIAECLEVCLRFAGHFAKTGSNSARAGEDDNFGGR